MPYTFQMLFFYTVLLMFPFLFNQSQSKGGALNQRFIFVFESTIGQLNVQVAVTEKER